MVGAKAVFQAVVVTFVVRADAPRETLGVDDGNSRTEALWNQVLTQSTDRGLDAVPIVVPDNHKGCKTAIELTLQGPTWQQVSGSLPAQCSGHFAPGQAGKNCVADFDHFQPTRCSIRSNPKGKYVHMLA